MGRDRGRGGAQSTTACGRAAASRRRATRGPVSAPREACSFTQEARRRPLLAVALSPALRGQLDSARARSNPCHRRRPPRAELGAAASSSFGPGASHCP